MDMLEKYVKAFEKTEISENYLLFSALSIFSACLGRRVWLEQGFEKIYPNLMIYLVGGMDMHKSTAINYSLKILNIVNSQTNNIKIAPTDTAGRKQGLLKTFKHVTSTENDGLEKEKTIDLNAIPEEQAMIDRAYSRLKADETKKFLNDSTDNAIYISAHELPTFFSIGATELYNLIIELYSNPSIYYYKLSQQDSKIINPSLSLLGGIRPLALGSLIPKDSFSVSILKNTLLVYEEETGKGNFPWKEVDKKLIAEITKGMAELTYKSGEMLLDEGAKEAYIECYNENLKARPNNNSFLYAQYRNYRNEFLLKIAIILASTDGRSRIFKTDIISADSLLKRIEKNMKHAYSEVLATDKASHRQLIKDFVISHKMVTREDVYMGLKDIDKPEIDKILGAMFANKSLLKIIGSDGLEHITTPLQEDFKEQLKGVI